MAELNTTANAGGTQTSTQSPQSSAPATDTASTTSSGIQPGTATDLLRSSNGIVLQQSPLTTVNLTASTQSTTPVQTPQARHINGGLLAFSLILFVVAVVLFWKTGRSVNNTTK